MRDLPAFSVRLLTLALDILLRPNGYYRAHGIFRSASEWYERRSPEPLRRAFRHKESNVAEATADALARDGRGSRSRGGTESSDPL